MNTPIKVGDKVELFGLTLIVRETTALYRDCQECCIHHLCARRNHLDNIPSHFTTFEDLYKKYNVRSCTELIGSGTNFGLV